MSFDDFMEWLMSLTIKVIVAMFYIAFMVGLIATIVLLSKLLWGML